MKTVLVCNDSGGSCLHAYLKSDKPNKQAFTLSAYNGNITIEETYEVKKTNSKQESTWKKDHYEYKNIKYNYTETRTGFKKTFDTLEKALNFLETEYNLKIVWEKLSKELTDSYTIEQKIAYSVNNANHDQVEQMHKNQKVRIIEIDMMKFIKNNPKTLTKILQEKFEGGIIKDFQYSLLSRLCHDYGKKSSPLIKQESGKVLLKPNSSQKIIKNEGWIITEQGLEFLKNVKQELKEKGYIQNSFY